MAKWIDRKSCFDAPATCKHRRRTLRSPSVSSAPLGAKSSQCLPGECGVLSPRIVIPYWIRFDMSEFMEEQVFDIFWEIGYSSFMSELSQPAWFYTREGEKTGPVTFSELKIKATEGTLNPRLDMAWSQGMETWLPLGEIEGLFERRTAPDPQDNPAPPADPYRSPQQGASASLVGKDTGWPGARRRSFIFMCLVFPVGWGLGLAAGKTFLSEQLGPQIALVALPLANLLPLIAGLIFSLKRLVNLGMSRWWYLGNFVPFLNFWVGFRCFACPAGYAFHKKLDGAGVFLAILYWLAVGMVILVFAALVALFAGALGTPELQQQIREALPTATAPKP